MNKFLIVGVFLAGFVVTNVVLSTIYSLNNNIPNTTYQKPSETYTKVLAKETSGKTEVTRLDLTKGTAVLLAEEVNTLSSNMVIDSIRQANHSKPGKPIYLLLDSPGGSVIDGARIISAIQASKAPVYTVCLQICASMAAMILEYGVERYAVDRSIVMFHPASIGAQVQGELDKVVSRFSFLQRFVNKMDRYTAERSGQTYEAFKAQSSRELWIDAEDALAGKYVDKIVAVDLSTSYDLKFDNNKMRQHLNLAW